MKVLADVALSEWCTLELGGAARWFCRATDDDTVIAALAWARDRSMPVHILGGGSNVVFADEGFAGLVVHVDIRGVDVGRPGEKATFTVGAGEPWDPFVAMTVAADAAGLECLSGIPGRTGGTPVQNVGAYAQEVSAVIVEVHAIERDRLAPVSLGNADCAFGYRTSRFKVRDRERFVVTRVKFSLTPAGAPTLAYADLIAFFADRNEARPTLEAVRRATLEIRRRKGMVIEDGNAANRSVGSFFVNPVVRRAHAEQIATDHPELPRYTVSAELTKIPAAWLIERAGFAKGFARGPVAVSPFQAQAIINTGGATAVEVLGLASDIKRAVWRAFQIAIVPEPVFVGFPPSPELSWLLDPQPRG